MITYVHGLAALAAFFGIFLKGIQVQNITHRNYVAAAITSYGLAVADVALVGFIAHNGWDMVLPIGTGGTLGILLSIYIHKRYINK